MIDLYHTIMRHVCGREHLTTGPPGKTRQSYAMNTKMHLHHSLICGMGEMLSQRREVLRHSVCIPDEGVIEITMDISEEDSDLLQEVIDRLCILMDSMPSSHHDLSFSVVTSYEEHDYPTQTTLYVEGNYMIIRTESQVDSGVTYRRRLTLRPF